MRACATSFVKSPTLAHVRTAPPAVELAELSVGVGPEPISASSTAPRAPATMQWAHGYSGCMGVSMNGVQPGARAGDRPVDGRGRRFPELRDRGLLRRALGAVPRSDRLASVVVTSLAVSS